MYIRPLLILSTLKTQVQTPLSQTTVSCVVIEPHTFSVLCFACFPVSLSIDTHFAFLRRSKLEESTILQEALKMRYLFQIFLLSPTTIKERLGKICEVASGFLYYVSLKGVTGSDKLDIKLVEEKILQIQSKTNIPLAVGFGIKDPSTAKAAGKISDAVVIGSALVKIIAEYSDNTDEMRKRIKSFMTTLREALDSIS